MYKFIKKTAKGFEDRTPNESVTGLKISTISVLSAFLGFAIAYFVNIEFGKTIIYIAILSTFYGMGLYFYGLMNKNKNYKDETKRIRENSKQPWE